MSRIRLDKAPLRTRMRAAAVPTSPHVDRKRRVIYGYSVITRGEALGHDAWVDTEMLDQVVRAGNEAGEMGVKARFTHPGLSSDGLGKALGRAKNFTRVGDQVFADLHLLEAASKAPDGDLAGYVMDLAEEDPEAFGTSIVFSRDRAAEYEFATEHGALETGAGFDSPDDENEQDLPHWRLSRLHASDVVDEPAANPRGLFSSESGEIAEAAERVMAYAFGLSDELPEQFDFSVHPDRLRAFAARFLDRRNLTLKEGIMTAAKAEGPPSATLSELRTRYGDDPVFVLECLERGLSVEQAESLWRDKQLSDSSALLEETIGAREALSAQLDEARREIEALKAAKPVRGEAPVLSRGGTDSGSVGDFMALATALRDAERPMLSEQERRFGVGMETAIRAARGRYPGAYETWRSANVVSR